MAGCAVMSVAIVAVLFVLSDHVVHRRNDFLRQFPPHALTPADTVEVGVNSFYVAGAGARTVYFGNTTSPLHVLAFAEPARGVSAAPDTQHVYIRAPGLTDLKFWALRLKVDSPYFFLADGAVPVVFKGNVCDWFASDQRYDSAFFVDFQPMGPDALAIRSVSSKTNEFVLGRERLDVPEVLLRDSLLQRQIDGRFCVDGMLHFSRELKRIVYLYYYRNQFIVADSNLNLAYRGHTIDTISRARIRIAEAGAGRMHSAPPFFVNRMSRVWKQYLFVNSALMSRNEERRAFENASVVDVYDLNTSEYRFSFYVPHINGVKMHDFCFSDNRLIVLIGRFVITYDLADHVFGG